MKKLINKLFEWLGYVPKSKYKVLNQDDFFKQLDPCKHEVLVDEPREPTPLFVALEKSLDEQIYNDNAIYYVRNNNGIYEIKIVTFGGNDRLIKVFKDTDADYAKLCAEELCEKLNERI